jgi:subtilase family serine protease
MSRYWDSEIFDVTSLLKSGSNEVKFLRGRDLNGDGTISSTGDKPEGEDYLHPVFAMLTLERPLAGAASSGAGTASASGAGTDLAIGKVDVADAYNGQTATITATLQNLGTRPSSPVTVEFSVDGAPVASKQVTVDASGVQQVTASWPATAGSHSVSAEVKVTGDTVSSNNAMTRTVTVGTLPDLEVSVGAPRTPGASTQQKSPLPGAVVISAAILAICTFGVIRRRNERAGVRMTSMFFILLIFTALIPAFVPAAAAAGTSKLYLLPVTVKNSGGSDAAGFAVTVYLDGEKIATKTYDDGLAAGKEVSSDIPINTLPGSHTVKVVVDEAQKVNDGNRGNNVAESSYAFP